MRMMNGYVFITSQSFGVIPNFLQFLCIPITSIFNSINVPFAIHGI